jgi:2-keto-4-pentenoate hydratase/2-oxohepta-3-ene-1,7-dioic acid hydratase in catechol pathway
VAKYIRYKYEGKVRYGMLDDTRIKPLEGDFPAFRSAALPEVRLDQVELLAPATPSKVISVGFNFKNDSVSLLSSHVTFWVKLPNVVNGPENAIELPSRLPSVKSYYEAELAVVIGKRAKRVKAVDAPSYIFGYTCSNDVTAGDYEEIKGPPESSPYFIYGKHFDGFNPIGPWIVTDIDASNLQIECRVNGKVRQSASSANLICNVAEMIEMISNVLTLEPGDVISMGTPPGVGALVHGDVVEVEVENIGILRNVVRNSK